MAQPIHNRKTMKDLRRELRSNLTTAETILWKALQGSKLDGRKFRRQHSIGNYIVDFYCPAEQLVVELDGARHFTLSGADSDDERTKYISSFGILILRFENIYVVEQIDCVLEEIRRHFNRGV